MRRSQNLRCPFSVPSRRLCGFARLRVSDEQLKPRSSAIKTNILVESAAPLCSVSDVFKFRGKLSSGSASRPTFFIINRIQYCFTFRTRRTCFLFRLWLLTFFETKCPPSGRKSSLVRYKDHPYLPSIGAQRRLRSTSPVLPVLLIYILIDIINGSREKMMF